MPRFIQRVFEFATVLLPCVASMALAQNAPRPLAQKSVTVTVVDAHVDPPQPVPAIRVSLTYLDGSGLKTDARDVTTPRGQAFLAVTSDTAQRDDLRLVIEGNPKLVIFEPADGQLHGIASTVPVKLLPIGSAALSGPAQIEAVQRRLSQRVASLQRQSTQQQKLIEGLQTQLQVSQSQADAQKQSVNAGLEEWAKANGLDLPEVQKKVQAWAEGVQADPAASAERKALAAFALKDYGKAGDGFGEARLALKKKRLDQARLTLQQELEDAQQQANSYQLAARFHDATAALEDTRDDIAAQQKAYPDDPGLRTLWLQTLSASARARQAEAEVIDPTLTSELLDRSEKDFKTVEAQYRELGDTSGAAKAQKSLADVLIAEANRKHDFRETQALMDRAISIDEAVLKVFTQVDAPEMWGRTQIAIGSALYGRGMPAADPRLVAEAVERYRNAFAIFSRTDHPQDWAAINRDVGEALSILGEITEADQSIKSLNGSVAALRNALEVYNQTENPQSWASTQVAVGYVLSSLSRRNSGEAARKFAADSVSAYRNALQVYTEQTQPQPWADANFLLAWELDQLAMLSPEDAEPALRKQSIEAFEKNLHLHPPYTHWNYWLFVKMKPPANSRAILSEGLADFRDILESDRKSENPAASLNVACDEMQIAETSVRLARLADDQARRTLFEEAEKMLGSAQAQLAGYYRVKQWPTWAEQQWFDSMSLLDSVNTFLGHERPTEERIEIPLKDTEDRSQALSDLTNLYHERIFRFVRAFELSRQLVAIDHSADRQLDYMEAALTAGHFDVCLTQEPVLRDAKLDASNALVRDLLHFTCLWTTGNRTKALEIEKALLAESASIQKVHWTFTGTVHFLADAPDFEKGRPSWIALFTAVQNRDADAMTKALHSLEPLMQN